MLSFTFAVLLSRGSEPFGNQEGATAPLPSGSNAIEGLVAAFAEQARKGKFSNSADYAKLQGKEPPSTCDADVDPSAEPFQRFKQQFAAHDPFTGVADRFGTMTPLARRQLSNFKNGSGILVNIHITHHAGTTFCSIAKLSRGCCSCNPSCAMDLKAAARIAHQIGHQARKSGTDRAPADIRKWATIMEKCFRTQANLYSTRNRMWSSEFFKVPGEDFWKYFPFESPNVFTVLVMRDPLQRLMSGSGEWNSGKYKGMKKNPADLTEWSKSRYANNYAMSLLSGATLETPKDHFTNALDRVTNVSLVIDMSCFGTTMLRLCRLLGWEVCARHGGDLSVMTKDHEWTTDHWKIQPQTMWKQVAENNLYDIALYLASKKKAGLEQCGPCRCSGKGKKKKCTCGEYPASLVAKIEALGDEFKGMVDTSAIVSDT